MTIRIINFSPIIVTVDDVVSTIIESNYQDEDGNMQIVSYIIVDGQKKIIQHRAEILEDLNIMNLDEVLSKVEIKRKDIESEKVKLAEAALNLDKPKEI